MNELKRIGVFTKVVQAQSFSEAARQLGVAKSAVSKSIRLLEEEIDVRLFNRSTRKLSLTEAGKMYYRHCEQIVNRAEIAREELHQYQHQPTGTLRVSAPIPFGKAILLPVIAQLRELYPQLAVDLQLDDRQVNLVEQGIDVTLRVGQLGDSNLVAKKLCDTPAVVFASPEYLARFGTPHTPEDLCAHQWIALSVQATPYVKHFRHISSGEITRVSLQGSLKVNAVDAVIAAAESGLGISVMAKTTVHEQLSAGKLVALLPDHCIDPIAIYALYPHREHLPPKVRVFLNVLEKVCRSASWATAT